MNPTCMLSGFATVVLIGGTAHAADSHNASDLEQVTVYASQPGGTPVGGSTVTQSDVRTFNRDSLDSAVELATGTSLSAVGARNETDVWIRGFDRWRVPLYQDGIPIYLPVDDRIDYGRFTTLDLSQIQISKGFASVIDGPGAMGGSINLVSRVVEKPAELDARVGVNLDSRGSYQSWTSDLFGGIRRNNWFIQGAGSFTNQNHFRLSDDYSGGTLQAAGDRIQSAHQDYKINLKAGYAPSEAAEYSINLIDQVGRKDNPPPDGFIPAAALSSVKYWQWPAWDKQSLYWLSKNLLDDRGSYLKTRLYYDRFYNKLNSYDTIAYSVQALPKSFDSTYDDRAAGGSIELSQTLPGGLDTIRAAAHFRWDNHNETESTRNTPAAPWYQQPWEQANETTSSLALENILHPLSQADLIAGASYDVRHMIGDSQFSSAGAVPPYGTTVTYPIADKHAWNGELALVYHYGPDGSAHLSYADRARFPTLFEMYSTRFGTFRNNPFLQPERSHYAQAGVDQRWFDTHVVLNVFYARVIDSINSVALTPTLSESENTGIERREGYEIELSRPVWATLNVGLNYSDLVRVVTAGGAVPTDTPDHKFFAYLDWKVSPAVSIIPSVDSESRRWLQSATNALLYYRGGDFTRIDLKASYQATPQLQAQIGARNLADQNYAIEDGYHAPGREYFANVRWTL